MSLWDEIKEMSGLSAIGRAIDRNNDLREDAYEAYREGGLRELRREANNGNWVARRIYEEKTEFSSSSGSSEDL